MKYYYIYNEEKCTFIWLNDENIQSQIGTYALHLEPAYRNMKRVGNLENSEKLFYNALTLPLHKDLTYDDQVRICSIIKQIM